MKNFISYSPLFLMLAFILSFQQLAAQNPDCREDTLILNTGYDPFTLAPIPIGATDIRWTVVQDPDPGTTEPRPAWAIPTYPGWQPALPDTRWISSYPTSTNDVNDDYHFEYCFCLEQGFDIPEIHLNLRADDSATVYFNANYIGATPNPSFNTATPTPFTINNPNLFKPGKNCLRVVNTNTGSVAMGINMEGFVTVGGPLMQTDTCCNPGARIIGTKYNDQNGDGTISFEPGLPGWTITLTDGTTTWTETTDALGNYYFNNIPSGTYTISEVNQPGWVQTFPLTGTYTVTVTSGQISYNNDFGNYSGPPPSVCDSRGVEYWKDQDAADCCYYVNVYHNEPNYFTGLELETVGGFDLTYNPGDIDPGWIDNAFGPNFVQLIPAPPLVYAPTGSVNLIRFCIDNFTTNPQEVVLKWYGQGGDVECTDTLELDCPIIEPICAFSERDTIYCLDGRPRLEFYINNPPSATFNVESFSVNVSSGGSVSPTYFTTAPIPPGTIAGPFFMNVTGAPGDNLCYTITVHDRDITVDPDANCCTSDPVCVPIPNCDPCGSVRINYQGDVTDCCFTVSLDNGFDGNFFYGIESEIITPGVYFSTITNFPGSGWTYTNTGAYSNTNILWSPNPSGNIPLGVNNLPSFCLNGYTTVPQQVVFKWLAIDGTLCTDTLSFDCPPPPPPVECAEIINDSLYCNADGTFTYLFNVANFSGQTINAINLHTFSPSGISSTPSPINLGSVLDGTTSAQQSVIISGLDAVSGANICFKFTVHQYDAAGIPLFCCTPDITHCVILPGCGCDEESNMAQNPNFDLNYITTGGEWQTNTGSPQYQPNDGCIANGSAQMWGNQVVGESIRQQMNFIAGETYRISYCARWIDNNPNLPPIVRARFRGATNSAATTFTACPAGDCEVIGVSPDLPNTWNTYTFADWIPANNYDRIIVQPENNFALNDGNFISWIRIDDICIEHIPADVDPCEEMGVKNDKYKIQPQQSTILNIFANDTGSNPDCPIDPCSMTIVTPPLYGNATILGAPNCNVAYSPFNNPVKSDFFDYRVCDECGCCDTARVYINRKPIIVWDQVDTYIGSPVSLSPTVNDTDGQGNPVDPCKLEIVSEPVGGSIAFDSTCGIRYTPNQGFEGLDTFDYQVCDADGYCDTGRITVTVRPYLLEVNAQIWLQGPYNPNTGLMDDRLRQLEAIPLNEPFTELGYDRGDAIGNEKTSPDMMVDKGENSTVDWIYIYLRDRSNPSVVITTQAAILTRNGQIVDTQGNWPLQIRVPDNTTSYLVTIRTRNHLIVSAQEECGCCEEDCYLTFQNQDIQGQAEIAPGVYGCISGDANGDGSVDSADRSETWNNRNKPGYQAADCDMNGVVDSADRSTTWNHRNSASPLP